MTSHPGVLSQIPTGPHGRDPLLPTESTPITAPLPVPTTNPRTALFSALLATLRGLKTINLGRDDATFAELTAAGADVVHVDDPDAVGDVRTVIGDARGALAVEAVGGAGVARLLELLSDGGWLVSYSWARDEPMWVDTSTLVGKHLTVRGFFVGDFDYRDKVAPHVREAAPLVADSALVIPVAGVYPLEHI